jgi:hypothetical protein
MNTNRNLTIDTLRAFAIILMLITHINGLLSNSTNSFISLLTHIGATVSYIAFLFCFAYIQGIQLNQKKVSATKSIKKGLILLFWYYVTAVLAQYLLTQTLTFTQTAQIFSLQIFPEYTEFLIPYALLTFLLPLLQNFYKFSTQNIYRTVLIGLLLYIIGSFISSIYLNSTILNSYIALIAGSKELHTFGLLSYAIPYLLGIYAGRNSMTNQKLFNGISAITVVLVCILLNVTNISSWQRWPPSVYFILYGLAFIFIILTIAHIFYQNELISKSILFLSTNTLTIFILNVIIIMIISLYVGKNSLDTTLTLVSYPIIISFILVVTKIFTYKS